jgi:TolB-like protein
MAAPSPIQDETSVASAQAPRRRPLLARVDRRVVRSVVYSGVTLLLFALFKAAEWLIEHKVAIGKELSTEVALVIALTLAVVFQLSHKRVEHVLTDWLNRAARTREQGLNDLAQEISLIRDPATLQRRAIERLDHIMDIKGSALYITAEEGRFHRAVSSGDETPAQVSGDDPAVIRAMLQRGPVAPEALGSKLPLAMIWPILVRGRMTGFLGTGSGEREESPDEFQVKAIGRVADAIGHSLALLDLPAVAEASPEPALALPDKPSIAVLPFQSLSADPEQEYFADGAVEDITSALSKFPMLFVISRNSSFTYKGRAVDVKQVGRELGVRYVLEGSVRRSGGTVRITGQLIDALTGAHLWADHIDGPIEDVFALQDRITGSVVGAIMPKIEEAEIRRISSKSTESLDAYEQYVRGLSARFDADREANRKALAYFRKAVEIDPGYALAHARIAQCFQYRKGNGWMDDIAAESAEACAVARRALELGRNDADVLAAAGFALVYIGGDLESASASVDRAVTLNPNHAFGWAASAYNHVCLGYPDIAVEHIAKAMRLSPLDPRSYMFMLVAGLAHFCAGRFEQAADWAAKAFAERPDLLSVVRLSAASNALAGRPETARAAIAHLLQGDPGSRMSTLAKTHAPFRRDSDRLLMEDGLRKAGLPE